MKPRRPKPSARTAGVPPAESSRYVATRRALIAGTALCALVFIAYSQAINAGFIWDDNDYVTANRTLDSVDGLRRMWTKIGAVPQYYPLVHTTFWIEHHIWGNSPRGYHIVNIALHAVGTLLLWRLLVVLRVPGAWFAAVLFGLHPVEVESVAWITERKNVLSLCLALCSMLCYLRYAPADNDAPRLAPRQRRTWYAAAFALFVLALLSKTVVATLPAVLLVIYWWKRGRIGMRDVTPLIPFFVVALALGALTAWMEENIVGAQGKDWSLTVPQRLLIAGRAPWFYASKLAWPTRLAFFYPRWVLDPTATWQWFFPAAAVLLLIVLWLARSKIGRGPLAAVLIFGGVLFPALGFFDVFPFRYSYVADHFQYHASIALLVLVAAAAASVASRLPSQRKFLAGGLGALVLVLLGGLTFCQTFVYYNLETLYGDTIVKNPRGWTAYSNLAALLLSEERLDEAHSLISQALELESDSTEVHANAGAILLRRAENKELPTEEIEAILSHYRRALELNPRNRIARTGLGFALIKAHRCDEAREVFEEVLRRKPNDKDGLFGMGRVCEETGNPTRAVEYFTQALAQEPENRGIAVAIERARRASIAPSTP